MAKYKKFAASVAISAIIGSGAGIGASYALCHPDSPIYLYGSAQKEFENYQLSVEQTEAQSQVEFDAWKSAIQKADEAGTDNFTHNNARDFVNNFVDENKEDYLTKVQESGVVKISDSEKEEFITNVTENREKLRGQMLKFLPIACGLWGTLGLSRTVHEIRTKNEPKRTGPKEID